MSKTSLFRIEKVVFKRRKRTNRITSLLVGNEQDGKSAGSPMNLFNQDMQLLMSKLHDMSSGWLTYPDYMTTH